MTKGVLASLAILALACLTLGSSGCGDSNQPTAAPSPTTQQKMDSPDPEQRKEGIDEAMKKYGGGT